MLRRTASQATEQQTTRTPATVLTPEPATRTRTGPPAPRPPAREGTHGASREPSRQTREASREPSHASQFGSEPRFWALTALLVLATPLTRLPFMTHSLYAFDSANYALAVRDFYNVAFHQPHPPGYPLYVFLARAIDLVVHDANRALILEGVLWSAIAVFSTVMLCRAMFGRAVGLLAGMLLLCTVGFWGYGEVAYPYVALAGETATLAWLAHSTLAGHRRRILWLGLAWAISAGVRWDAAVFCAPLWLWALTSVNWRLRFASVALAAAIVVAWAVPMIQLTGGWDVYRQAMASYLHMWSAQSAYVVGDFASGGDTQATYNLNFLINYLRQMLGIGLIVVLYALGRRFGPLRLAADQRSRVLGVWVVPPLLVYVYAHLGEPGYVLSLAPQAAILIAVALFDLGDDSARAADVLRARGWRWLPRARYVGMTITALLSLAIVGWNVQAFARGVGPGRLPDLRAHDATTSAQVEFLRLQPADSTLVLAHDVVRQLAYYRPGPRVELLYSEYVPDFAAARTRTELPLGAQQVVILDGPLQVSGGNTREVVLSEQPRVTVSVVDVRGARAIEYGYHFARVLTD